jgi:hypothetical protein
MSGVSLRDIGQKMISSQSAYGQQLGEFSIAREETDLTP